MTKRQIVSKQYKHRGGTARLEMDTAQHYFVHCSGCRVEQYAAGMAPGLRDLGKHVGIPGIQ